VNAYSRRKSDRLGVIDLTPGTGWLTGGIRGTMYVPGASSSRTTDLHEALRGDRSESAAATCRQQGSRRSTDEELRISSEHVEISQGNQSSRNSQGALMRMFLARKLSAACV
jgi:hypothetical protein